MKILIVVDKIPSAIWICARVMEKMKDWFGFDIIAVHPKRPSTQQLEDFRNKAKNADLIDFRYWKTSEMLLKSFSFLDKKKKILTHHNPYDLDQEDWFTKYDKTIVRNKTQKEIVKKVFKKDPIYFPYTVDLDFYKFQRDYPEDKIFKVNMVAARIESKKGILEVAKACRLTNSKFILVGRISDMNYMRDVMVEGGPAMDFRESITDEELRDVYYQSHLHINNSTDGFESGTLPILESMACGCPVLTRNIGHVPDLFNEKNMVVRFEAKENVDELISYINILKEDRKKRLALREEGFKTVVGLDNEYAARRYYQIYREALYGQDPLVTVVIPTYNRKDSLFAVLTSVAIQDYRNIEAIVVDDGSDDGTEDVVKEFKESSNLVVKYIRQEKMGYGLARARNTGAVEANGSILIFMDDRFMMDRGAVADFVKGIKPKVWLFGDKGANKKSFVENFSCVHKRDFIRLGMFNERIVYYGGMTRDIINRMSVSGMTTEYCPEAKVKVLVNSKSRFTKKEDRIKAGLILWKLWGR